MVPRRNKTGISNKRTCRGERGTVLGLALIYFAIFSLTGLAALSMAAYYRVETAHSVVHTTNDLALESVLNEALWRINSGPDSLANFTRGDFTVALDSSDTQLSITGPTISLTVELEEMHPFNHGVAYRDDIDTSTYSVTVLPGHGIHRFNFLPPVDTAYYRSHAVAVYNGNVTFDSVMTPGIHFVEKGNVFLKNGSYLNGTLVIMGKLKVVGTEVTLNATTDTSGVYLPALIVADSTADMTTTPGIIIRGPIYSTGPFDIKGGTLTGPLVGTSIVLSQKLDINDQANEKYYRYPPGFGDVHAYDWPKRIIRHSWQVSS